MCIYENQLTLRNSGAPQSELRYRCCCRSAGVHLLLPRKATEPLQTRGCKLRWTSHLVTDFREELISPLIVLSLSHKFRICYLPLQNPKNSSPPTESELLTSPLQNPKSSFPPPDSELLTSPLQNPKSSLPPTDSELLTFPLQNPKSSFPPADSKLFDFPPTKSKV
jgi:hypothetical protein